MKKAPSKTFSHYFLNKKILPPPPKGFSVSSVLAVINKNNGNNKGKILFVKQKTSSGSFWGLPKGNINPETPIDDLIFSITRTLEKELGLKGTHVLALKPTFTPIAIFFNFTQQTYDQQRSELEKKRNRPHKGKIYELFITEYTGSDKLPINYYQTQTTIVEFCWVNLEEGLSLSQTNIKNFNVSSAKFNIKLFTSIFNTYRQINLI